MPFTGLCNISSLRPMKYKQPNTTNHQCDDSPEENHVMNQVFPAGLESPQPLERPVGRNDVSCP